MKKKVQRINKKTFTELGALTLKDWKRGRGKKKKNKKGMETFGVGLPRFLT